MLMLVILILMLVVLMLMLSSRLNGHINLKHCFPFTSINYPQSLNTIPLAATNQSDIEFILQYIVLWETVNDDSQTIKNV